MLRSTTYCADSNGKVKPATCKEFGIAYVTIDKPVGVLEGLSRREKSLDEPRRHSFRNAT
jgi:hypothetical protein